jgi:HK97 family phage major capsid protein
MKTLKELYEKREGLILEMDKSIADEKRFNEIDAEIKTLDTEIRQAKLDAAKKGPPEVPEIPEVPEVREEEKRETEYRGAFLAYVRKEELSVDEKRALSEGTDSAGGYTVPSEMGKEIIEKKKNIRGFRALVDSFTSSSDRDIPVEGGIPVAEYISENGAYPESDPSFGNVNLKAYKQGFIIKIAEELLQDTGFNLHSYLVKKSSEAIANFEEDSFITGNGTGKPTGIATTAEEVVASTDGAITYADLKKLVYSELKNAYHSSAVMILNQKTFSTIKDVRAVDTDEKAFKWDNVKNAWLFDGKYPVVISDYAADIPTTTGSGYPVFFGDLSYYKVADRLGFSVKVLNERYADNGQVGFRVTARNDGKLAVAEAVKKLKVNKT